MSPSLYVILRRGAKRSQDIGGFALGENLRPRSQHRLQRVRSLRVCPERSEGVNSAKPVLSRVEGNLGRKITGLRIAIALTALVAIIGCGGEPATTPSPAPTEHDIPPEFTAPALPTATITFTNATGAPVDLLIEIADTPEKRQRGLMFRDHLAENQGMLFDFRGETQTGFWMKDTSIPLSIAFISAQGLILDIQEMLPFSTDLHQSDQPYAFALEVNQGWFERNDIDVGNSVQLPPSQRGRGR